MELNLQAELEAAMKAYQEAAGAAQDAVARQHRLEGQVAMLQSMIMRAQSEAKAETPETPTAIGNRATRRRGAKMNGAAQPTA